MPGLRHDFTYGIDKFMGPGAFEISWTNYQKLMIEKLNQAIAGNPYLENRQAKEIAIMCARDPDQAATFNYASMSFNNAFFFEGIQPKSVTEPEIPAKLKTQIESSFGSVETLRRDFILTASSMFGPGFVWLMKDRFHQLSILVTYLAGSPFSGAHNRKQEKDMNTESNTVADHLRKALTGPHVNTVGAHGPYSKEKRPPGGIELTPLLCVNTWEHVWIPDYGIEFEGTGGKKVYVENWWNVIDWEVASKNANLNSASPIFQT